MGSPRYPTPKQLQQLQTASEFEEEFIPVENGGKNAIVFETEISAQGVIQFVLPLFWNSISHLWGFLFLREKSFFFFVVSKTSSKIFGFGSFNLTVLVLGDILKWAKRVQLKKIIWRNGCPRATHSSVQFRYLNDSSDSDEWRKISCLVSA